MCVGFPSFLIFSCPCWIHKIWSPIPPILSFSITNVRWIGSLVGYILYMYSVFSGFYLLSPDLCPESSLNVNISTANEVSLQLLQPYLSVMLNKGSLEVLVFTGSHSLRRVIRRPEQGILNDGREHSLRIERLPGRLVFVCLFILCFLPVQRYFRFLLCIIKLMFFVCVCVCVCLCGCFPPDLLQFRWTRRPRGRQHFLTTSQWACGESSSVEFLQKWSRRPTEPTSHSRDVYGTWWSTLCT